MAANLTPQYLEAEAEYKKAQTPEERLACLKTMWSLLPKHKASEKLQAELKTKMSDLKEEIEQAKKHPKKGGVSYKVPKQGAGQYVIVGAPNAGKMPWQDVAVQLIDTPPITPDDMEGYVSSMVRSADRALLIVDLADDDGPFAAEAVLDRLAQTKTVLVSQLPPADDNPSIQHVKTLLVANKIDAEGAGDRLEVSRELFGQRFAIHVISAEHGEGLEELRDAIYQFLSVLRVYTKQPGTPPDMTSPFTCPSGSTLVQM